ncbi:MAG: hypothetical protein ACI4BD_07465 [Paludibacteraceae bacterium]
MLNYYNILSSDMTSDGGVFRVALNADCEVYRGHFPGEPVCPGVCNIQMIKECAVRCLRGSEPSASPVEGEPEKDFSSFLLNHIQQCRLTTLVTPQQHPEAEVRIAILGRTEDSVKFRGTIGKGEEIYMELKGEMRPTPTLPTEGGR